MILPVVSQDLDDLLENFVRPFEEAGYVVRVKFREAKPNEAAARVVARELSGGQLINSFVVFMYDDRVEETYEELAEMTNSAGEPYGYEEELENAA